jgi:thioredoxin reductase
VEIGTTPSTEFISKDLKNNWGKIITDAKTQRTNQEGIWAAGDCTDALYQQNNIAVGDAVKAVEDLYLYLKA